MLRSRISKSAAVTIAVLFGWMTLSSTIALAERRCDNRKRDSRYVDRGRRSQGAFNRINRDQRYYRSSNNSQYRLYDRDRNYARYRDSNRYRDRDDYRYYDRERSDGKSALIIAGSTSAGAAVGAIAGGAKGAAIGAITGGVAGLIYDRHTDNRR